MASSQATIESYDAVEFTVARGVTVRGRCLTISQAIRMMRLFDQVRAGVQTAPGEPTLQDILLEEFITATDLGDARISPVEVFQEVLPHFLSLSGIQGPSPETTPDPSSSMAGMT